MRLKPTGKIIVFIIAVGLAVGVWRFWNKIAPSATGGPPIIPHAGDITQGGDSGTTSSPPITYVPPGREPGCTDRPEVRLLGYAWNAQMGLLFAIGGPQSATNSLMCKHGVNLKYMRQDDNGKMQEALVAFATELSQGNPNPTRGAHFCAIMGDGGATFLKGLNDALKRLGSEYKAKVVGSCGYSRGEDKFMGPAEWKTNPVASRGGFVAGVLRDGDWNIAQKWLGDNGLRTNPDEKTYDPDALNWVNASDYIDAAQKYIAGYSEDRPVAHNGKRTGETKHVTVNGVVTWTPGDVTVAQKKGGLVSIVSTKQYSYQMPCVIIGIDKWMRSNRATVEGMLAAIAEGGDIVKSNPQALKQASAISAEVYKEAGAGPDYWEKYYRGTQEPDKTGVMVDLGGSSVNNLADMLLTFGLVKGAANVFAATYQVFGDIVVAQYPQLLPNYPSVGEILDTSYLQAVARKEAPTTASIKQSSPHTQKGAPVKTVVSSKKWDIHFDTGKATFSPDARRFLEQLSRDVLVAGGTVIEVHGHTDNQGNPNTNMALSEARAFAVKRWLEARSPVNFPEGRIRVFAHGQQNPVAPNATPQGRAQNRRVVIILGTTQ
jgi:OOP family OmpA-OmpF porin